MPSFRSQLDHLKSGGSGGGALLLLNVVIDLLRAHALQQTAQKRLCEAEMFGPMRPDRGSFVMLSRGLWTPAAAARPKAAQ